jgi:hypothetical protein
MSLNISDKGLSEISNGGNSANLNVILIFKPYMIDFFLIQSSLKELEKYSHKWSSTLEFSR